MNYKPGDGIELFLPPDVDHVYFRESYLRFNFQLEHARKIKVELPLYPGDIIKYPHCHLSRER